LFDVTLTEDDLKIETCWSLGDWYVKVYFNTDAFVGVNYRGRHKSVNTRV